jgi:hypothetical protein
MYIITLTKIKSLLTTADSGIRCFYHTEKNYYRCDTRLPQFDHFMQLMNTMLKPPVTQLTTASMQAELDLMSRDSELSHLGVVLSTTTQRVCLLLSIN